MQKTVQSAYKSRSNYGKIVIGFAIAPKMTQNIVFNANLKADSDLDAYA